MTPNTSTDSSGPLDASPMTRAQIGVIIVAVLLSALDGYDVLGMAYVAPAISHDWGLHKAVLGVLLSTSLIGMALGSLTLTPLADIFGRRPMAFAGVSLMVLGSLLSALAQSVPLLAGFRILTGVGIGVVVPLAATIAAEFSSVQRRALTVTCTTVGFTAGSVIGSFIAAALLRSFAWHSVFISGAVAAMLLIPVIAFGLPESPAFLIARRGDHALARLNAVLVRRQNIWRRSRLKLTECRPRLGVDIRRRVCGVASADVRWSAV